MRGTREDVVIKVLKPGIEDILVADLNFVYIVARILEFLSPDLSRASLVRYFYGLILDTLFYPHSSLGVNSILVN